MNLKENINKIHFDLSNKYDVKINENSDKNFGNFIELIVENNNRILKIKISKQELSNDRFNWNYLSNPNDSKSIVERSSTVFNFTSDVGDIFEKNRFDSDYIKLING